MTIFQLLAAAVATIIAFFAGGLWYGPLFGKAWQAEQGMADAQWAKANKVKLFAISLGCEGIVALFLAHLLGQNGHDAHDTMMIAVGIAVGFVLPALVMNYAFALKSVKLMAIDGGHWLLVFVVIGLVFVAMHV